MSTRTVIEPTSAPALPRHVKLRHDKARDRWVLLAPERMLIPDAVSLDVLQRLDGEVTVNALAETLATEYDAPAETIRADLLPMLQDLADKGFLKT